MTHGRGRGAVDGEPRRQRGDRLPPRSRRDLHRVGAQLNPPPASPSRPAVRPTFAQSLFFTTVRSPYAFGATNQLLNELSTPFNTASWRSIYSATARGRRGDHRRRDRRLAGQGPAGLPAALLATRASARCCKGLDLGRVGQGDAGGFRPGHRRPRWSRVVHGLRSSSSTAATRRQPQVTQASIAIDVGKPINPPGIEAQMHGGLAEAISTDVNAGLHLVDGLSLEGSYSPVPVRQDAGLPDQRRGHHHARRRGRPRRHGEVGMSAPAGAIANAYARATGTSRASSRSPPADFDPVARPPARPPSPEGVRRAHVHLHVNGEKVSVDAPADMSLLWVLRDKLGITGPKYGCGINVCKACTCQLDGKAFNPCSTHVSRRRRARRSRRSRGSRTATSCTRCSRRGSSRTCRSAASASPARSWRRSPC